jgi:hypothetical protein
LPDSTYIERVKRAASRYADMPNPDGGWGLLAHASSSIVNTSEVLAVLRTAGYQADSPVVRNGVKFLVEATQQHPQSKRKGGRGEHTRYVAYGLLGLSEYPHLARQPDVADAINGCIRVLERFARESGGWPEIRGESSLSLFQTATGIIALQRVAPGHRMIKPAVRAMLGLRKNGGYRARSGRGEPSVPHTALAAIALRQAGARTHARAAATWVGKRPDEWQAKTHSDSGVPGTGWIHMTFGLGLRALVLSGEVACDDSRIEAARAHIDALWNDEKAEWRDGSLDEERTSVRSTYAAILAYRALVYRAGRDTVNDDFSIGSRARPQLSSHVRGFPQGVTPVVQMLDPHQIELDGGGGPPQTVSLGSRTWELFQHVVGEWERGVTEVSIADLAKEFFATSLSAEDTAARTLRRVNQQAKCNLLQVRGGVVKLIAEIKP